MRLCAQQGHKSLSGIGVDTWGVDFGLLGVDDRMLGNPLCYRDAVTVGIEPVIRAAVEEEELYRLTGWPVTRVSTLSELVALHRDGDSAAMRSAKTLLMMADLFRYLLCGHRGVELTAGSSGQLVDIRSGEWCEKVLAAFCLPRKPFPTIVQPATVVGRLDAGLAAETGLNRVPVVAVAGHDTASAAAAAPFVDHDCAFISCGTWSVVGAIQEKPNTSCDALAAGFVNEFGLNSILFVKNIVGLYLFESLHRILNRESRQMTYAAMVKSAAAANPFQYYLDINSPHLFAIEDAEASVRNYLRSTGQKATADLADLIRVVLEALAWSYRASIAQLTTLTGQKLRRICLVGGGSRNRLLCQMAADATGIKVISGPAEATVIGNLASQALATKQLETVTDIRELVRESFDLKTYRPRATDLWDEHFHRYQEIADKSAKQGKPH
jgi:sugar (pentulose or hexulose) kinase